MILHVKKLIGAGALAEVRNAEDGTPIPEGWEAMTVAEFEAWRDAQLAAGWAPPPPPPVPEPVPEKVTRRQLFLAVNERLGLDRATLRATLTTEAARIEFDEGQDFERDHALVNGMASRLVMTSEQVDDLFRYAKTL